MEKDGIITNALYAKFATEVRQIQEEILLKQVMSDSSYTGTINDLLGTESDYNNKLIIQEGNLVYVANEVSSQETKWLESLGIEQSSDYYTVEFDSAGGTEIGSQTIKTGTLVKKPSNPTKTGHEFLGWYYLKQSGSENNPTYTEIEFDFNTEITSDYSLYAKYSGEAVMMARNNNYAFWQADIRTNITNIVFTNNASLIPDNSEYSWDMRADTANGGTLMAYLSNGENLIIYSPYVIYANVNAKEYFSNFSKLISISFDNFDTSKVATMFAMFYNCSQLTSLNMSSFNTSKVTNMQYMFYDCNQSKTLDVSNFDTNKVTTMHSMFYKCNQLTSLDISKFNTSNVKNMNSMFYYCSKLETLDVSNFDTSNVAVMFCMFGSCSQLTSIDVSKFDTSKVTNMEQMFYGCSNLTSLNLSNFDTSNVKTMWYMFGNCSRLNELNFKNWKVSNLEKVTSKAIMFNGIPKTTYIYVDDIDMKNWILSIRNNLENIKVNEL